MRVTNDHGSDQFDRMTFAEAREFTGLSREAFLGVRRSGRIPTLRQPGGQAPGIVLRKHCEQYLRDEAAKAEANAVDAGRDTAREASTRRRRRRSSDAA